MLLWYIPVWSRRCRPRSGPPGTGGWSLLPPSSDLSLSGHPGSWQGMFLPLDCMLTAHKGHVMLGLKAESSHTLQGLRLQGGHKSTSPALIAYAIDCDTKIYILPESDLAHTHQHAAHAAHSTHCLTLLCTACGSCQKCLKSSEMLIACTHSCGMHAISVQCRGRNMHYYISTQQR